MFERRFLPALALLGLLGLAALVLLRALSEEHPPPLAGMLERSRQAASELGAKALDVHAEVRVRASADDGADEALRAISGRELRAQVDGAVSAAERELTVRAAAAGDEVRAQLRANAQGAWLGFEGVWVRLPGPGGEKKPLPSAQPPEGAPEAASKLIRGAAELLASGVLAAGEAEEREGLWFYPLAVDATAAAERLAGENERADENAVKALLGDVSFELAFDPHTDLPRRLDARFTLSRRQLDALLGERGAARGVREVAIALSASATPKTGSLIVPSPPPSALVSRRELLGRLGPALVRLLGALGAESEPVASAS